MSYQLALCGRIIKTGDLAAVLNFGITDADFTQAEARGIWEFINSYFTNPATRGSVVNEQQMRAWFKELELMDMPALTTETLCHEVRRQRVVTEAHALVVRLSEDLQVPIVDPTLHLAEVHAEISKLLELGTTKNTDVSFGQGLALIQRRFDLAQRGVDTSKMKWPWQVLNDATFGLQPDDYIVLYGRPKSMKTWVLCYLIAHAFQMDKKILVYTKEMTPENVFMRMLSCIMCAPYNDLREAGAAGGRPLSPAHIAEMAKITTMITNDPQWSKNLTVLSGRDASAGGDTVSWLNSKVEKYAPDILFVDGMYLLSDGKKGSADHTRVMNISRELRQLVLSTGVPVIATMQANRKAEGHGDANLGEIAYSDALGQDATIAARVIADPASPTVSIVIGGSREFKLRGFRINAVPSTDFSFHSTMTEKDVQKAKEGDAEVDEEAAKKKKKKETLRKPSTPADMEAKTDRALKDL